MRHIVKEYAGRLGISKLAPHDLRRFCDRFCHDSGGELEQIQFLLGHVSVQTTEKYLGCKQRLRKAVMITSELNPADGSMFQELSGISCASLNILRKDSAKALMSAILSGCKPTRSASFSQPSRMRIENTRSKSEYRY